MKRREFISGAAATGAAATAVAASSFPKPAIAQTMPEIKWRCASSFPKSLDTLYGGGEEFTRRVAEMTDNKFQIRLFAGGEIVPAFAVLDACKDGTVECGHTVSYYYVGKDPTFAFDSAIPFGLNARQQNAWLYHGGGGEIIREFFNGYNIIPFPGGNTGAQMGGWFRKEIKTIADLKGLKFRIAGFAGQVVSKLGVVPQQLAGADVYPALEKGTIDAAEWVGPYDDEKLGLYKVAPYYYFPSWWEGGPRISFYVNADQWNRLPKSYQAVIEAASMATDNSMLAKYDVQNPAALKRLVAGGAKLRSFSKEIMDACYEAAEQTCAETAAKNAAFKKVYDSWVPFRSAQLEWFGVAESAFDRYMQLPRR